MFAQFLMTRPINRMTYLVYLIDVNDSLSFLLGRVV